MLKNHWFLKLFLKGQAGPEHARAANSDPIKGVFSLKKVEKRSKTGTNEPLDMRGKYDAYMFGLDGPKTKMLKNHRFLNVF